MGMKKFLISAGAGLLAYFAWNKAKPNILSPEKALEMAKKHFHSVNGSWIYMKPETIERYGKHTLVYKAGITVTIDGKTVQKELVIDAKTGQFIED
ncbi:MAG: PepSY domain-containing protein [Bacillaceae bacterium]|nr:PepSY domain-containing protein [Bacillaceae bacterium]